MNNTVVMIVVFNSRWSIQLEKPAAVSEFKYWQNKWCNLRERLTNYISLQIGQHAEEVTSFILG